MDHRLIPSSPTRSGHRGEHVAAALAFLCFFCVLAAYYVIRPVRDQLSAAVGSTQLPWFYAATFIATLALTPVFAGLVARYPRRVVVPSVYLFFIGCLLAFVPLFRNSALLGERSLGVLFFVWVSVFNLFVVSVFWSLMADIWDDQQARRLYPIIALGGTAGAVAGPLVTGLLVGRLGVAPLLLVSAALLGVALTCVIALDRWARRYGSRPRRTQEQAVGGGMLDGLRQLVSDPFMRAMAGLMLLGDAIGGIGYALLVDYSGATFTDAVARTRFAAQVDLATNVLQVVVQLTLTRWLLVRRGAAPAFAVWAAATTLVLLAVALVPDPYRPLLGPMPMIAIALIVSRGFTYGMQGPARESLYTLVPRSVRYKGKNAVDTAVWRLGDVATALTMNALRTVGTGIGGLAALSALAAVASGTIGWRISRKTERSPVADEKLPVGA